MSAMDNATALDVTHLSRVGYLISALLICAEYLRLGIFYRSQHTILFISFAIKLSFLVVEIGLSIAFAVIIKTHNPRKRNTGAVLEWGMSFVCPPGKPC